MKQNGVVCQPGPTDVNLVETRTVHFAKLLNHRPFLIEYFKNKFDPDYSTRIGKFDHLFAP